MKSWNVCHEGWLLFLLLGGLVAIVHAVEVIAYVYGFDVSRPPKRKKPWEFQV